MSTKIIHGLLLFVFTLSQTNAQVGRIVNVQNGRLSPPITGFKPYKYELELMGNSGVELLGSIPKGTLVTILGKNSGKIHHTTISREIRTYNDFKGAYETSSILLKQPQWESNIIILNAHEKKKYETLGVSKVTDTEIIKVLDKKVRNSNILFNEVFSSDDEWKRKQNLAIAKENNLPLVQKVEGSEVLLVTYGDSDIFRKGLLYVNDKFYPLYGECPSPPHFYKLGETLYLKYRSGTCESGHILVFYYAILKDNVVAEWGSDGYSN